MPSTHRSSVSRFRRCIAAFALSQGGRWPDQRHHAGVVGARRLDRPAQLSDRYGRVRTLQVTILWFSLFTFAVRIRAVRTPQLLVLKALQGFGFGGEWAAGAVLMAETIRPENRGKAMGTVQSAWAVGWGAAVLLFAGLFFVLPQQDAWRVLFGVGLLPALLVIYVRRAVPEPQVSVDAMRDRRKAVAAGRSDLPNPLGLIFAPGLLRVTMIGGLLGVGAHGGYYALMTWLPTYLQSERHLSVLSTGGNLAVIIVAFWCGCIASAQLLDRIGRRATIATFAICCVLTVVAYLFVPLTDTQMLIVGFPLGFFAAGIPASLGALFNELYPVEARGAGVGFCYNFGRVVSAGFPWLVGHMSTSMPLGRAVGIDAGIAYGIVVVAVLLLPETRGRSLTGRRHGGRRVVAGDRAAERRPLTRAS